MNEVPATPFVDQFRNLTEAARLFLWKLTRNLTSVANAIYVVRTADATLPNALVATDSATVTLDYSTAGQVKWNASGAPGAPDTSVQFNDGGSFGGDANLTWDKVNGRLALDAAATLSGFFNTAADSQGSLLVTPTGVVPDEASVMIASAYTDPNTWTGLQLTQASNAAQIDALVNGSASNTSLGLSAGSQGVAITSIGGNVRLNTTGGGIINLQKATTITGIAYPTADGSADQVLVTDGAGTLSFADVSTIGYWGILTNGNPAAPEVIFDANGDVISTWTAT